jgi:uncharacterized membrane protein
MSAIFVYVFTVSNARLKVAVDKHDWPVGGMALGQIPRLIGTILILGLATIAVAAFGWFML